MDRVLAQPVEVYEGDGPLILAMPHTGTHIPDDIFSKLNGEGRLLRDTDWHVDQLYESLAPKATFVRAIFHRYVIDANRDPSGASLYPGQNTTGLVPMTNFDGENIWLEPPSENEIERRRLEFHAPYHAALAQQVARIRRKFGAAVLYDCHSIRSQIPYLFDDVLPDLNIGTNNGATCAKEFETLTVEKAEASEFTYVINGRFKGGWTTRRYGNPEEGVHAIQMELAQARYLMTETPPFDYDATRAEKLRFVLRQILASLEVTAVKLSGEAQK